MKKRNILASLVLVLSCLVQTNGSLVWAQEPDSLVGRYRIETTPSHLCYSMVEQLAGTPQECIASIVADLKNRGIRVSRIPYGTWVVVKIKPREGQDLFTTQGSAPPSALMDSGAVNRPDQNIVYNRLSVELQKGFEGVGERFNTLEGKVQTLADKPTGTVEVPQEFSWLLYAILAVGVVSLGLVVLGVLRSARNLEEGHGRTKPLEDNPFEPSKARDAIATLTALVAHDEKLETTNKTLSGELKRVSGELDAAVLREKNLAEELKRETAEALEAKKKLATADADLKSARESGKASEAEIKRLEGVAVEARKRAELEEEQRVSAEARLAEAAAGVRTALAVEEQATRANEEADATLKRVADDLEPVGGKPPKK